MKKRFKVLQAANGCAVGEEIYLTQAEADNINAGEPKHRVEEILEEPLHVEDETPEDAEAVAEAEKQSEELKRSQSDTTTMAKFTVKAEFELEGVKQEVGAVVELSEEKAAELGESVEKVAEEENKETSSEGTGAGTGA